MKHFERQLVLRRALSLTAASILISLLVATKSKAEGSLPDIQEHYPKEAILGGMVFGANRRVRTKGGYVGVKGSFSEPQYVYAASVDSKPSYYVGAIGYGKKYTNKKGVLTAASGTLRESDCGIQWEPEDKRNLIPAGWSAFISYDGAPDPRRKYTSYRPSPTTIWRIPRGSLGTVELEYHITNGGETALTITQNSSKHTFTFYWNELNGDFGHTPRQVYDVSGGHLSSKNLNFMSVKRVIAITQATKSRLDGSFMEGSQFSDGEVALGTTNASGALPYKYVTWSGTGKTVDQHKTGYVPEGVALERNNNARWAVDFDYAVMAVPAARNPSDSVFPRGEYRKVPDATRYANETVHIFLKPLPAGSSYASLWKSVAKKTRKRRRHH